MTEIADLSLDVLDHRLNVRVVVIIETPQGFIFEQDLREGFYVFVGGRIKIGETSLEAAIRELYEEIAIYTKLEQLCVIENFFTLLGKRSHAYEFIYKGNYSTIIPPDNFYVLTQEEMKTADIRPKVLKELILQDSKALPQHIIYKDDSYK